MRSDGSWSDGPVLVEDQVRKTEETSCQPPPGRGRGWFGSYTRLSLAARSVHHSSVHTKTRHDDKTPRSSGDQRIRKEKKRGVSEVEAPTPSTRATTDERERGRAGQGRHQGSR